MLKTFPLLSIFMNIPTNALVAAILIVFGSFMELSLAQGNDANSNGLKFEYAAGVILFKLQRIIQILKKRMDLLLVIQ